MHSTKADSFSLALTGDALMTRKITPYARQSSEFEEMVSLLRTADATVSNLEVTVGDFGDSPGYTNNRVHLCSPPAILDDLVTAGCDMFSAATNHIFDYGPAGMERTMVELDQRDIAYAGIGGSLFEASKPAYLETGAGRVALINACSSIVSSSIAGKQTEGLRGRPGLSPLRVERIYKALEDDLTALRSVTDRLGIEEIKTAWLEEGLRHGHDWNEEEFFHFWDMKFQSVEDEDDAGVEYLVNKGDSARIREWIAEADRKADWVVVALHAHHGAAGHRNTKTTPMFVQEFARESIDAGADAFVGTGPHFLRGIEIYENRPVFYSLGNFVFQIETVDRLPAADYDTEGVSPYDRTTRLTDSWFYDDGQPTDFLERDGAWETVIPICQFQDRELTQVELYPCTLQQDQPMPQRGIPMLASEEHGSEILADVGELSAEFGTDIECVGTIGVVSL